MERSMEFDGMFDGMFGRMFDGMFHGMFDGVRAFVAHLMGDGVDLPFDQPHRHLMRIDISIGKTGNANGVLPFFIIIFEAKEGRERSHRCRSLGH